MGEVISIEELKAMLLDKELLKELPLSKVMIDHIVSRVKEQRDLLDSTSRLIPHLNT